MPWLENSQINLESHESLWVTRIAWDIQALTRRIHWFGVGIGLVTISTHGDGYKTFVALTTLRCHKITGMEL